MCEHPLTYLAPVQQQNAPSTSSRSRSSNCRFPLCFTQADVLFLCGWLRPTHRTITYVALRVIGSRHRAFCLSLTHNPGVDPANYQKQQLFFNLDPVTLCLLDEATHHAVPHWGPRRIGRSRSSFATLFPYSPALLHRHSGSRLGVSPATTAFDARVLRGLRRTKSCALGELNNTWLDPV